MEQSLCLAYRPGNSWAGDEIFDEVSNIHNDLPIERIVIDGAARTPANSALNVVLFDEDFQADSMANSWLKTLNETRASTPLFPIALNPNHGHPPTPIAGLKSRFWPNDRDEILVSVSAALGLALRPGENKIFVSYRQADGKRSAELIENALLARGFSTWRDESNTLYDDPNLLLGEEVQQQIEANLASASALVLIDTPRAGESSWVRLEVEMAVGKMIPIFPVVLHDETMKTAISRFRVLQSLHRRAVLQSTYDQNDLVAPESELDGVVNQVERYLQRVYQNRVVQLRDLEQFLASRNCEFTRNEHLPHLHNGRLEQSTRMMSLLACCSFEDHVFAPRVRSFIDGMAQLAELKQMFNCNFYLYPGQTLGEHDLLEILAHEVPEIKTASAELLSYNDAVARVSLLTTAFGV